MNTRPDPLQAHTTELLAHCMKVLQSRVSALQTQVQALQTEQARLRQELLVCRGGADLPLPSTPLSDEQRLQIAAGLQWLKQRTPWPRVEAETTATEESSPSPA